VPSQKVVSKKNTRLYIHPVTKSQETFFSFSSSFPSLSCANDSMSDPNLLDSSKGGVLDSQLDLDQRVVLDVIRNTTDDEKLEDLDFEEGGLRGWLAVLGAQVSTQISSIIISAQ
jgi:hypothetical protein